MAVSEYTLDPSAYADGLKCPPDNGIPHDPTFFRWFNQRLSDGQNFLDTQPGARSMKVARQILRNDFNGRAENQIDPRLSDVQFNRQKRQFKERVFTLANAEPEMGFDMPPDDPDRPTTSDEERHFTEMLNKRLEELLARPESRQRLRDWLYLSGIGIAYISPIMGDPLSPDDRDDDVKWIVYDADDVLFSGMGRDRDVQQAEAVLIKNQIPLQRMRDRYPGFKFALDYNEPWYTRGLNVVTGAISRVFSAWDIGKKKRKGQEPTVLLWHIYVNDRTVNRTGSVIKMGYKSVRGVDGKQELQETAWSYDVPTEGGPVPTGMFTVETVKNGFGQPVLNPDGTPQTQKKPIMRPATEKEARIYPNRRLIMCTDQFKISDGPAPWAHALTPIVPFRMEDAPTEFITGSFFLDTESIQREIDRVMRGVADTNARNQRPPFFWDSQQLAQADATEISKFIPAASRSFDSMDLNRPPIIPMLPPEYTHLDPKTFEYLEFLFKCQDYASGTDDVDQIQNKGQIPESDSIEQLYQKSGTVTTDCGRRMELAMKELCYMTGLNFAQFDSLKRRLRLAGPNGINAADFDYDPTNMIPSHMPGEDTSKPSYSTRLQRVQYYMGLRKFFVVANSAYGTQNTAEQLKLQLLRDHGFPISDKTVARVMHIKNYPDEFKEWSKEQKEKAEVTGGAAAVGQAQVAVGQVLTQLGIAAAVGQQAAGAAQPQGGDSSGGNVGRPNTYGAAAHTEMKDGGTRPTIATS